MMAAGDRYRILAAEFRMRADGEPKAAVRAEWRKIALSYGRLATLADKNNKGGLLIEIVEAPSSDEN